MHPSTLDSARTEAIRDMIERQCRARGINDERVLAVMAEIPRERFVAPELADNAYSDQALPIGHAQTISQPYIVALMTAELGLTGNEVVLEVGTGSGYQTAILARLSRHVHTIERVADLAHEAEHRLSELGIANVMFHVGDGSAGWPKGGPYDRIIVTAGAPSVPEALVEQLMPGGRLVIPVGDADTQTLVVVERQHNRRIERPLIPCRFVKLIGADGWHDE
jgi:protein-L-isoaspartate(D-aspartate) O-methyltransferase